MSSPKLVNLESTPLICSAVELHFTEIIKIGTWQYGVHFNDKYV